MLTMFVVRRCAECRHLGPSRPQRIVMRVQCAHRTSALFQRARNPQDRSRTSSEGSGCGGSILRYPQLEMQCNDVESCRPSSDTPVHRRGRSHRTARTERVCSWPARATFPSSIRGTGGPASASTRCTAMLPKIAEALQGHRRKRESPWESPPLARKKGGRRSA